MRCLGWEWRGVLPDFVSVFCGGRVRCLGWEWRGVLPDFVSVFVEGG